MVVLTQAPYLVVRHFGAGHFGTYFAVAPGQVAVGAPSDSQCTGPMCPVFAQPRGVTLEFFLLRGGVLAAVNDTEIRVHGSILRVGASGRALLRTGAPSQRCAHLLGRSRPAAGRGYR